MAKFIRQVEWRDYVKYRHDFRYVDSGRGFSGFMFDCDEHGNLLNPSPAEVANYQKCLSNTHDKPLVNLGIQKQECTEKLPAIIECRCGQHVELWNSMTNRCDCGQFYNGSGQELCDPRYWGEETGERFDDNGNQYVFVDD